MTQLAEAQVEAAGTQGQGQREVVEARGFSPGAEGCTSLGMG